MQENIDISMIDTSLTVPSSTASMINTGGLVILSVFLVVLFILFVRYKPKFGALLFGILGYVIFIFLGSNLFLGILPEFASTTNKVSGIEICVKSIIIVACYTIARICVANIMKDRYQGAGDILIAGAGLGLGDGVIYGITMIMPMSVLATHIQNTGLAEVLATSGMTPAEQVDFYITSVAPLLTVPPLVWLMSGISLAMDFIVNIALMMLNCGAANGKLPRVWYALSAAVALIYMLPFTFNMTNYTSLAEAAVPFLIKIVLFVVIITVVLKIDKERLGSILKTDLKGYTYERMPRFGSLHKR